MEEHIFVINCEWTSFENKDVISYHEPLKNCRLYFAGSCGISVEWEQTVIPWGSGMQSASRLGLNLNPLNALLWSYNPWSDLNCKVNSQSEPKSKINPQSAVLIRSANPCKIFVRSEINPNYFFCDIRRSENLFTPPPPPLYFLKNIMTHHHEN
jgi:hypothetical protein